TPKITGPRRASPQRRLVRSIGRRPQPSTPRRPPGPHRAPTRPRQNLNGRPRPGEPPPRKKPGRAGGQPAPHIQEPSPSTENPGVRNTFRSRPSGQHLDGETTRGAEVEGPRTVLPARRRDIEPVGFQPSIDLVHALFALLAEPDVEGGGIPHFDLPADFHA